VCEIERAPAAELAGYLRRGDFSRWLGEVFGDRALASELRELEDRCRRGDDGNVIPEIVAAVRGRYDLTG